MSTKRGSECGDGVISAEEVFNPVFFIATRELFNRDSLTTRFDSAHNY